MRYLLFLLLVSAVGCKKDKGVKPSTDVKAAAESIGLKFGQPYHIADDPAITFHQLYKSDTVTFSEDGTITERYGDSTMTYKAVYSATNSTLKVYVPSANQSRFGVLFRFAAFSQQTADTFTIHDELIAKAGSGANTITLYMR